MSKLTPLICPACGAKLNEDKNVRFCPYCGTTLKEEADVTVNINKTIKKETIDHTEIAKMEYDERMQKRFIKWVPVLAAIVAVVAILVFVVSPKIEEMNRRSNLKKAAEQGLVCAGDSSEYKEENYQTTVKKLEGFGFTNVTAEKLKRDQWHILYKGLVEEVIVDGKSEFTYSDYFEPDVEVTVMYWP